MSSSDNSGVKLTRQFADYRNQLLKIGCSEDVATAAAAKLQAERESLDRGRCPSCGEAITRRLDPRQAGAKPSDLVWVNYRCACGHMSDWAESERVLS